MTTSPQLSPDLRPVRYCPNCGQRVAQKAEVCFMCGQDLRASQRRQLTLPLSDLLLILVVLGVAYLWWTRGGQSEEAVVQPVATVRAAPTDAALALAPSIEAPAAQTPTVQATLPVTASAGLTLTAVITATAPLTPTAHAHARGLHRG
jgi:predicted nucleic acid-binding Zn ribbon protein